MKLDGILSMKNSDDVSSEGNNPNAVNEFDLGKLDLTLGFKLSPSCTIEIGARPEIYGKNSSAGTNMSMAVTFTR